MGKSSIGWVVGLVGLLVVGLGLCAGGLFFVYSAAAPEPTFTAVVAPDEGQEVSNEAFAAMLEKRFENSGVFLRVVAVGKEGVTIDGDLGHSPNEQLVVMLRKGELGFHKVDEAVTTQGQRALLDTHPDVFQEIIVGSAQACGLDVAAVLDALALRKDSTVEWLVYSYSAKSGHFYCPLAARRVELGSNPIKKAMAAVDWATMKPYVSVQLSPQSTAAFHELTKKSVGERIAITLDDHVIMAPTVNEPIDGGRVQINLGGFKSQYDLEIKSKTLATLLDFGPMGASGHVKSIDVFEQSEEDDGSVLSGRTEQ